MSKRYKVIREDPDGTRAWSVGYPSLTSARAAARRLNSSSPETDHFRAEEMGPADYPGWAD